MLVDDHQLVIDGIRKLLESEEGIEIVATANDGVRAVELFEMIPADVIMMDIDMPIMNGMDAARNILQKNPETGIVFLSMHEEAAVIRKVMELGAKGYLLKTTDRDELLEAVRKVAGGGRFFSAEATLNLANNTGSSPENKDTELLAQLTEREMEILRLIAEGYSNKEIGDKLFISHRTVDTHRTNLARKIDAKNIAGLIRFAVRAGIVES